MRITPNAKAMIATIFVVPIFLSLYFINQWLLSSESPITDKSSINALSNPQILSSLIQLVHWTPDPDPTPTRATSPDTTAKVHFAANSDSPKANAGTVGPPNRATTGPVQQGDSFSNSQGNSSGGSQTSDLSGVTAKTGAPKNSVPVLQFKKDMPGNSASNVTSDKVGDRHGLVPPHIEGEFHPESNTPSQSGSAGTIPHDTELMNDGAPSTRAPTPISHTFTLTNHAGTKLSVAITLDGNNASFMLPAGDTHSVTSLSPTPTLTYTASTVSGVGTGISWTGPVPGNFGSGESYVETITANSDYCSLTIDNESGETITGVVIDGDKRLYRLDSGITYDMGLYRRYRNSSISLLFQRGSLLYSNVNAGYADGHWSILLTVKERP